jgi:hypothetical protein
MTTYEKIEALAMVHDKMDYVDFHSFKFLKHMKENKSLPMKAYDRIDEYFDKYCK